MLDPLFRPQKALTRSANAVTAAMSPLAAFSIRARATGRNDGNRQDGAGGAICYLELGVALGVEVPPAPMVWPRRCARRASRACLRALRRAVRRCTRDV